ncbi:MAG: exodeoxyribonuclease V subunit gamma [FCB group bacterium]|nr:exodeoxyribonuclease V subunit gamma [FCB group bacterium]MBL7027469.1 exodeoxyribonuclease V subunit gamma [Candidatus Neomarinimicrobiota bacterium]MBL7122082.1 exodeoxyribonuclease V subunit gamma [Candidatus Neomarinimicrobiota bacterium]
MSIDLSKVFDLNKNVFIEACAGAGKTWLLSKRYSTIMNDFARQHETLVSKKDASNILVITFTRKAAAEMAGRIYEDLNKLLNDESLDNVDHDFGSFLRSASQNTKMHLRSTFSKNAISTIDSFCAQILREQAERLDIDPEFRIQDEADTQRMELETWEKYLGDCSRNGDQDLKILLEHLSVRHISEYVKKLQSSAQLMVGWLEHHSSTSPEDLQAEFKMRHPLPVALAEIESALIQLLDGLPSADEMLDSNHSQYQSLRDLKELLSNPIEDDYRYGQELIEFARRIGLTKDRKNYLKRLSVPSNVWPEDFKDEIKARLRDFKDKAEQLFPYEILMHEIPSVWDIEACLVNHHLAKFFQGYWAALNQRLKREGILSFNEVMLKTRDILRDDQIAALYGQRYQHILFDEFQDTNDVRWDIVRLIAEAGQGVLRNQGLFIVGDTKQSIYRFNQADVQVMNRVGKIIDEGDGWVLTADETYRSSQKYVVRVINPLISSTFPGEEDRDKIELYETVFRPTNAAISTIKADINAEISSCTVSVVLDDEASRGSAVDIFKTADLTLEWLEWIKENKLEPESGPSVGILLRSFTPILDYIRIFTSKGIEFEVLSSKGLFEQQESYDIYHLISVLANPLDDQALVGILRSPFFVMKDEDIQRLKDVAKDRSSSGWVWNGLKQLHPEICDNLRDWQQASAREPLDRLIEKIISEDERRLSWISETGGVLRLANLDRIILMVHQLSLDGLGLREIHEYFKFQIQHGDASQAELPGAARVQILTIHKAKGLEYPVVLLPGMQSPTPSDRSGVFIGRHEGDWQAGITLDSKRASHKTWMHEQIKEQTRAEEEAEDKRLFYVAVTRAKFGIGFIAKIKPETKAPATSRWGRYLQPVFDLELDKDLALNDPHALQKEWNDRSTSALTYDLTLGSDILLSEAERPVSTAADITQIDPVMQPLVYSEISPHTIMKWMDKKKYAGAEEGQLGDDLDLETAPKTFGLLLHRAMEMEWFIPENHLDQIRLFLEDGNVVDAETQNQFIEDLTDCLEIYRKSQIAQKISHLDSGNKLPELPVFGFLKNNTHIFKVSGIIDLLYQSGDEWVVLDYKTDKEVPHGDQLKQHAYWYQIQTYLWMLKHLYGIEARGELYFNRFDTLIPIAFEEDLYFANLATFEHGRGLKPILPGAQDLNPSLTGILERQDDMAEMLIIEPTKNSGELLAQSLAKAGLNHPRLQIMTLGEVRKMTEPAGRRLTPYLTRLGIAQLSGKRLQWGVVNRLAEAFYKATGGESVVDGKLELYAEFLAWCEKQSIQTPGQNSDLKLLPTYRKIIVNSIHSTSPADYDFLKALADDHDLIFFDPLRSGQAVSGFDMSIEAWMSQEQMPSKDKRHSYTPCFSIYEEAVLVGDQIRQLIKNNVAPADIRIAVSSMERYVPAIKRVFDQQGISVRLSKREPVMERPVTQLAFALIQGRLRQQVSWDMAMSVWLHPLVIPSGADGYARLKLDIEMRKLGVTQISETLPDLVSHPKLQDTAKELLQFLSETWQTGQPLGLVEAADWLVDILKNFQFAHRLDAGSVASKSYTSLKNAILGLGKDWKKYLSRKGSLADLNRELRERLRGVEVASSTQGFGIDVISLLDTLNLKSGHLFVMGLTEGQFPLTMNTNPYLKAASLNPWFLNLYLFKQWLSFPSGQLHLSAPTRNADGAVLQESTFCQYLEKSEYPILTSLTQDQQYIQLSGKRFATPSSQRRIRHNQLQKTTHQGAWQGKLYDHDISEFDHISASAFDELIKCPQRYWYSRKLRLEAAETNIAEREEIEVGNLVHKVLERFGRDGGFLLANDNFPAALQRLEEIATALLKEKEIDLDADLLHNKWGELYFRNFQDVEQNLIAAMLKMELSVLPAFRDVGLHEQAFGDAEDEQSWPAYKIEGSSIKLSLLGKIDRVLVSGKQVWATDYKTGKVDIKESKELWTSQMLFYYLVLKSQYPGSDVVLTYEQIKGYRDNAIGLKGYIGDVDSDHPVMDTLPARSKATLAISDEEDWTVERIKAETLSYAQALADNHFPLTTRDEKHACAYCPFDRICRKTALPR